MSGDKNELAILPSGGILPILATANAEASSTITDATTAQSVTFTNGKRDIIGIDNESGDNIFIRWKSATQTASASATNNEWDDVIPTGSRHDYYVQNDITGVSIFALAAGDIFVIQI